MGKLPAGNFFVGVPRPTKILMNVLGTEKSLSVCVDCLSGGSYVQILALYDFKMKGGAFFSGVKSDRLPNVTKFW